MKPGAERVANPELTRLAEEHQERRLERVLGVVGITQQHGADAEDHRPMPLNQRRKCQLGLIGFGGGESLEQLPVREVADRAQVIEGAKLSDREPLPPYRHASFSSVTAASPSHFISIRQAGVREVQTFDRF